MHYLTPVGAPRPAGTIEPVQPTGPIGTGHAAVTAAPHRFGRWARSGRRTVDIRRAARVLGTLVLLAAVTVSAFPNLVDYRIKRGDTLTSIAERFNTTPERLLQLNRISGDGDVIYAGRVLHVPGSAKTPAGKAGKAHAKAAKHRVPDTFAGRTYPSSVAMAAARNRRILASRPVPSRHQVRRMIVRTARTFRVDPNLALAISWQESGWNQRKVSVANAIGAMQVIPSSGRWASDMVGRRLNLLETEDNIVAGVAVLRALTRSTSAERAVAGYYQGLASVNRNGMYADTRRYVANVMALRRAFARGER
jgi:LysM repeat protein